MNDASEVKLHFLDYWRIIKVRAGLITLAFLLVMITAGVTTYFLPRQYYSKVTMEVKQDNSRAIGDVLGGSARAGNDPMFVPTQFQALQKKSILYPVIESLDLVNKWSAEGRRLQLEGAYLKLRRMLDLREVRNTGMIDIGVYSTDAQEAANIANTIAVQYRQLRLTDLKKNIDSSLDQLREEVEKQRLTVEKAATEAARIRQEERIIDPETETSTSALGTPERNIVELEKQLNEQRQLVTKLSTEYELITKLKPEQLKEVLRTLQAPDETVIKMVSSLQDALREETKLYSEGLGERHPSILALRAQARVFQDQLSAQLDTVRENHANKLQINKDILADLEARFAEYENTQIEQKKNQANYIRAKNHYLQEKAIYQAAMAKLATEALQRGIDFDPAKIWEKAEPSLYPAKPNVPAYMALAAIVGLVIGIGLAFFIEYLDTSVKTLEDVEKYLDVPVLAVIAKNVSMLIKTPGDTPDAEAYRILRANIEFNKPDRNANTYTLVSGGPGEGKSTTLNNLAYTCAQGGYNVLVVDADLRRPTQHRFFDTDNNVGLTDYLTGKVGLDEITKTTKIDNLSFIASGQLESEAVGILNSQRMVELISKVKQQYDLVFFDSPPILGVSDGSVLASECDITIMVVQHRRFPRAMLQRVKQAVIHAGGTLIGVVLNNVDARHDDGYSYYNAYNDYYTPKREAAARRTSPAPLAAVTAPRAPLAPVQPRDGEEY